MKGKMGTAVITLCGSAIVFFTAIAVVLLIYIFCDRPAKLSSMLSTLVQCCLPPKSLEEDAATFRSVVTVETTVDQTSLRDVHVDLPSERVGQESGRPGKTDEETKC